MAAIRSGGPMRKFVVRMLTTGALLGMYAAGMLASTGALMTAGVTPAMAQRGRGGRGGGGRGGRGRGVGTAVGVGIGAAIVGGMIAAESARQQAAEEAAIENCMRRFKSYNPETGTYMGRDGRPHPCP